MAYDKNGNKLKVGDVVGARFLISQVHDDADGRNLICTHKEPQFGLPDNLSVSLESGKVELLESAPAQAAAAQPGQAEPVAT